MHTLQTPITEKNLLSYQTRKTVLGISKTHHRFSENTYEKRIEVFAHCY